MTNDTLQLFATATAPAEEGNKPEAEPPQTSPRGGDKAAQAIQAFDEKQLEQTDLLLGILASRPLDGTEAHQSDG